MTAFVKALLLMTLIFLAGDKRTVQESEIKEVVEKFIASHFEDSVVEYRLEYRNLPTKVMNIPQKATLHVAAEPETPLRGSVLIPVEVFANNRVEHTFVVSVKLRTYERVFIATEKIEKREPADEIAATEEKIETTNLPPDVIKSHAALTGKRSKQIIRQGAVLRESMFERIPVVHQGSRVTLIMKRNNVVVRASAIAREDGGSGDVVVVQKEGSSNRLKARVVDANTVELLAQND